jgi:ADP-ribosylglycohydrolase
VHDGIAAARRMLTVTDPETAAYFLGNGREVAAHDTVPFAIWAAARHLADYEQAIWATAAAGGDIDTPCAIVGGKVHWQAGDRPLPAPVVTVAGESALWVDPAEIPSDDDISKLCQALAAGRHGDRHELMAPPPPTAARGGASSPPSPSRKSTRPPALSPSTARSSRSPGACTSRRRRTASTAGRSTPGARSAATRSPSGSPPGSRRPEPSRKPGPTPSG